MQTSTVHFLLGVVQWMVGPSPSLLFVSLFAVMKVVDAQPPPQPSPRCQDCWCVPSNDEACPSFQPGLREGFPSEWISALASFQRVANSATDDTIVDIEKCFPFPSLFNNVRLDAQTYPQSALPTCEFPVETDETVCGFVFPNAGDFNTNNSNATTNATDITEEQEEENWEPCQGRSYYVQTFANTAAAAAARALVVHTGACGVCSNAQDLAARAATLEEMNPVSILCVADYAIRVKNPNRFADLVQCYQDSIVGLTKPCATLWAHFGAANGVLCPEVCFPDENGKVVLNNPDTCALSECLSCSAQDLEGEFNALAGLYKSPYNAGLLDSVAYPCERFDRVLHDDWDPCQGAITGTAAPSTTPNSPATSAAASPLMDNLLGMTTAAMVMILVISVVANLW